MSVRFFRILLCVLCAHVVIFSVVWIGFPTPGLRPHAIFTYEGALPAEENNNGSEDLLQQGRMFDKIIVDHLNKVSDPDRWVEIRNPTKP